MIGRLRVAVVAVVLVAMTLILWPLQSVAIARDWRLARRLPHLWHLVACRVAGIRLHIVGAPARRRPLLIAANHQSWSDIMVLGRVMPLSFIAKAEVRSWPAFGLLARLQRTVFVEREARRRTGHQANMIAERLLVRRRHGAVCGRHDVGRQRGPALQDRPLRRRAARARRVRGGARSPSSRWRSPTPMRTACRSDGTSGRWPPGRAMSGSARIFWPS